ncbi:unnamed protein product [Trichobilharzia regenti]|nr:unnamed protein product [Trichobilharzia regenti]
MVDERGYSESEFAGNDFDDFDDEEYCDRVEEDEDEEEDEEDEDDYKEENARQETEEQARALLEKAKTSKVVFVVRTNVAFHGSLSDDCPVPGMAVSFQSIQPKGKLTKAFSQVFLEIYLSMPVRGEYIDDVLKSIV